MEGFSSAARVPPCETSPVTRAFGACEVEGRVHEGDVRATVHSSGDDTHDRPILRAAIELLEAEAVRSGLRNSDLGEQLVGCERGLEEASEEFRRANLPFA